MSAACAYKVTSDWSPSVPYARVCIPTHVGMKRGIPADSYIMRINPYGSPDTDYTSKTFYKGFIQNGALYNSYCGSAMH